MANKPQPSPIASPASSAFRPAASRGVTIASYLLMLGALMLVMWEHLLPGLLCVCIGFLVTRWFARLLASGLGRIPALARRPGSAGSVSPLLAAICGILIAGGAHTARASARPLATMTTAGIANPVISFFEDVISLVLSVLAILVPVLAFVLVLVFAVLMLMLFRRLAARRRSTS